METKLIVGNSYREKDKKGRETGRWVCRNCYKKDYDSMPDSHNNIMKSFANCRTGCKDSNYNKLKGNVSQDLACILYGWEDLNKKNDNYSRGSPIDCYDPNTGLFHQVQGRYYNSIERYWPFGGFKREWEKIFEDMLCFCFSEDGNIVERIYKFPWKEIMRLTCVEIYEYDSKGNIYNNGWYEEYRIKCEDELKRANSLLKIIKGDR